MGEYAKMMLDGTCCECCGAFLDGEAQGFPRYCSLQCARDRGAEGLTLTRKERGKIKAALRTNCPECGKRVKVAGLKDHLRDVHGGGGNG